MILIASAAVLENMAEANYKQSLSGRVLDLFEAVLLYELD